MNNAEKSNKREQSIKELFVGKCWSYLNDNFHKFDERNKIKIALELCKKDLPQEINGMDLRQIVVMNDVKKNDKELRYQIGNPDLTEDTGYPQEVTAPD